MSTPLINFFGMTSATPDFLRENGIFYTRKGSNLDVFAEKSSASQLLVYLLFHEGQLRVVSLAELQRSYPDVTAEAAGLNKLLLANIEGATSPIGQLIYKDYYADSDNRSGLGHAAHDAALSRGVTHATARWFGRLVQEAFSGMNVDQQFTTQGVRTVAKSFLVSDATLRRQLGLLQNAGALTFTQKKSEESFLVRYNKACLPGIAHELAPHFFQAICY